jgi:acyl-coenzyme A synthetase/AMP-(fatty) acid ligase
MDLTAALRRRLARSLPMVFRPARLTVLDRLPMLPSGKIDLVALTRLAEG